jgi:hypothetical protein
MGRDTCVAAACVLALSACTVEDAPTERDDGRRSGILQPADGGPSAADLMDRIASCDQVVGGTYANGSGQPSNISICGLPGAVFWHADLDVDCDGKVSAKCNTMTDPWFMDQTAAVDSNGDSLDAAALPFVVIPGKSTRFDYRLSGLAMGSVVAVIYEDKLVFGVLGDVGPTAYIGEASYRMTELLGIDPDPRVGGVADGVSYIAFTGADARVMTMEDHDEATDLGISLATDLLAAP